MAQRKGWTRWFRIWGPKRPARRKLDDFADYGTAFGLDLSLAAQAESLAALPDNASAASAAEQPRFSASS